MPGTVLKMIGFEVQGVPAVGLYFTFAILQPVGACSPHLDDLIGSFPPGCVFPGCFFCSS